MGKQTPRNLLDTGYDPLKSLHLIQDKLRTGIHVRAQQGNKNRAQTVGLG